MRDDTPHDSADDETIADPPSRASDDAGTSSSALRQLPSMELQASPQTLWTKNVSGSGGGVEFQLSLSGSVSARFAEGPAAEGGAEAAPDNDGGHEVEVPRPEAAGESTRETIDAELSVTYTPPTKLVLSATFPMSRSFKSTLGTCDVEGFPTFELDVTVKPDVPGKPGPAPRNAAEFRATYGPLFESVDEQLVTFRSGRHKRSRLTLGAGVLLALIGWALAGWSFARSAHNGNSTMALATSIPGTSTQVLASNASGHLPGIGTALWCTEQSSQSSPVFSTVPGEAFSVLPSRSVQECIITVASTGGADLDVTGVAPSRMRSS
jgi:hypothetical protein